MLFNTGELALVGDLPEGVLVEQGLVWVGHTTARILYLREGLNGALATLLVKAGRLGTVSVFRGADRVARDGASPDGSSEPLAESVRRALDRHHPTRLPEPFRHPQRQASEESSRAIFPLLSRPKDSPRD
jgi:hypothetical protein